MDDAESMYETIDTLKPDAILMSLSIPCCDNIENAIKVLEKRENENADYQIFFLSPILFDEIEEQVDNEILSSIDYFFLSPYATERMAAVIINKMNDALVSKKIIRKSGLQLSDETRAEIVMKQTISRTSAKLASKYLDIVGIQPKHKGYSYLCVGLSYIVENSYRHISVTGELYKYIGKLFNVSPGSAERAIRNSIEVAWNKGDIDNQYKLFGYTVDYNKGRPTNNEFISTISERIRNEIYRKIAK